MLLRFPYRRPVTETGQHTEKVTLVARAARRSLASRTVPSFFPQFLDPTRVLVSLFIRAQRRRLYRAKSEFRDPREPRFDDESSFNGDGPRIRVVFLDELEGGISCRC